MKTFNDFPHPVTIHLKSHKLSFNINIKGRPGKVK